MKQMACESSELFSAQRDAAVRLTPREIEILKWSAVGKTADDVGQILQISPHTVGEHLKNVRRKLQTSNIVHSVIRAIQLGQLRL